MKGTKAEGILDKGYKALLGALADKIEYYAVKEVEEYHAVVTGKLRNAIHIRLEGDAEKGYQLICYAEGEMAPYAEYVHEGRKAGIMPPVSPLLEWVRKKKGESGQPLFPQIGSGMVSRTRLTYGKKGISAKKEDIIAFRAANRIAWGVAKEIEKRGIPAKPYFLNAVKRALKEI